MTDNKNPVHYGRWKIQPIEFIRANQLDFARANIIKYIMRFDAKDGIKDLDKAQQYMDWLREDFLAKQEPPTFPPSEANPSGFVTGGKVDKWAYLTNTKNDKVIRVDQRFPDEAEKALYDDGLGIGDYRG